ncbi:hypothetical protein GIB67_016004 [Kingdonia uniflora]|uniref:Transposase MuDR plant domain-containing protein n=1 Tax=Kingdonia uniflora TaxID=39325 RepID=A0A7J7L1U6_9MAGN|nr:hypothetical protein GIB67_016004 [Kingdonia uniflora]
MVKKKENSKKNAKGKMKLIDEDDPITISDNGENEYPPPERGEILRHSFPKDMWAQGDESYPMRTHFYTKPTDVVREMVDEAGDDKKIDIDEIDDFEIETPVNIMAESKGECDDIDEEQERWVRYVQAGIDCLGDEDGYYSTHSSDDEDYVPTAEDLESGNEFKSVDVEFDDIYSKEEDDKVKIPLTVGFNKLEVGMQWATVYEAKEHMRRFGILNHFTYICIKNDSTKLRLKCSQEKCYHDLPSLCVEILKSNPGSIARTWRQDDTLQWTGTLVAFKASLNGFVKRNECKDSWFDFLTKIEPYLSAHLEKLTFISDRQNGLIDLVFFSPYHFVASYVATYSRIIHPISDDTHWTSPPYVVDLPPLQKRMGRHRKERIKGDDEVNKEQKRCGKYGAFGHNRKTCKGEPIQIQRVPVPKTNGRPLKKSTRVYFSQSQQSDVTQAQTTLIVGRRGSSGRASNAIRGRGMTEDVSCASNLSNAGRGRGRTGDVLTLPNSSNSGRGRGRTEGVTRGLDTGRARGRAMQTNDQSYHHMPYEEVMEAGDDHYQMVRFHYLLTSEAKRRNGLRLLVEEAVTTKDKAAGNRSRESRRYPANE